MRIFKTNFKKVAADAFSINNKMTSLALSRETSIGSLIKFFPSNESRNVSNSLSS